MTAVEFGGFDMPRTLTQEQIEAKRARKRAYDHRVAEKNAALRSEAIRLGLASDDINSIPPQVLARGVLLREMMRTPMCMWLTEWTADI